MNDTRIYMAIGLVLTAILLLPVSFSFATSKLTPEQKQAVNDCVREAEACEDRCEGVGSNALKGRLEQADCKPACQRQYEACVDKVISRRAPRDGLSGGLSSPPQVAPPKPTPRKISPQQVGEVTTDRAGATAAPLPRKPIDRGSVTATTAKDSQSTTTTATTSNKSPTPEPRKKKKKE